jgi:hypothetical protein
VFSFFLLLTKNTAICPASAQARVWRAVPSFDYNNKKDAQKHRREQLESTYSVPGFYDLQLQLPLQPKKMDQHKIELSSPSSYQRYAGLRGGCLWP